MLRTLKRQKVMDSGGFTLIEVIISMVITVIVMAAVFGLLTRGQRSFEREPQIADLQQSARTALDMVSRDVLQAGAGLPPEFPSISPINGVDPPIPVGDLNPDVIEIIGASQSAGRMHFDPVTIELGDDNVTTGTLVVPGTSLQVDDMVLVYDNLPTGNHWSLKWIVGVQDPTLTFGDTNSRGVTIPDSYRPLDRQPESGPHLIARVSVVRYFAEAQQEDLILMRQVDFGNVMPVGMIDDFQVSYMVGTQPPVEQPNPLHPQLDLVIPITAADIISGVQVTVTARSASENLEGAETGDSGDYIRKSFSTNISTRNILNGLAERTGGIGAN
jgi:prepilin-type N-terminal cleavage/methylation domain-containing protein